MLKKLALSLFLFSIITPYSYAEEKKEDPHKVTLGGYFDTEYILPLGGKDIYFDHKKFELKTTYQYNKRLLLNMSFEIEHGGTWDGNKDGELKIEKAYFDFKAQDWLTFRSGVFLMPLGRMNMMYESYKRDTTSVSLFNKHIVPIAWVEPGLGFYGDIETSKTSKLEYSAYISQGLTDDIDDEDGLGNSKPFLFNDNNNNKAISGRIAFTPFSDLSFGASTYFCKFDKKNDKYLALGVGDFAYSLGNFKLSGEGGMVFITPAEVRDNKDNVVAIVKGPMFGYTLEAGYKFFPEFAKLSFLGKDFENPSFTIFGRADQVDTDMTALNSNDRMQFTLGFNYRPLENIAMKFEYQYNLNTEALLKNDPTKQKLGSMFLGSISAGF
ncbi:MAG: hypothetical protein U0457_02355 [Candidatus Sericytochromatia bacterium]